MTEAFGVETIAPRPAAARRGIRAAACTTRGVPVTPGRSVDFARALALVRPVSRRRLYWTARAIFVSDPAHARPSTPCSSPSSGTRHGADAASEIASRRCVAGRRPAALGARLGAARPLRIHARCRRRPPAREDDADEAEVELHVAALASDDELLRRQELRRARAERARAALPADVAPRARHAAAADAALGEGTTRRARRPAPDASRKPAHRRRSDPARTPPRRVARRRLVMICDISGSMEPYARAYLQLLTSAAGSGPHAEAFVFATRLTRLTRALATGSPERAIQAAAAAAPDWSSGTRIGEALRAFNDRHGRRGMARGAVVVIISDGWERGDPSLVGREMERLARLAHRIVWVNPRVGAADVLGAVGRDGGGAAALRCARERPQPRGARRRSRRRSARGGIAPARPRGGRPPDRRGGRAWASATPVPGSSVAMPSGYGPSRGKTTRDGRPMTRVSTGKTCIYPGCERPGGAGAPDGRPTTRLLRPRGAQRADGAPGAAAPRDAKEATRDDARTTEGGDAAMADEAYRAVFLRVHPTGKMVLSLTTESDGKEGRVRAARRRRARRSRRST